MDNPFPERGFWPLTVTYLIYIVLWEAMWIGGTAYVVFFLGHDPLWFILAVLGSQASYNPGHWRELFAPPDWKSKEKPKAADTPE